MRLVAALVVLLLVCSEPRPGWAQASATDVPGSELTVYLVTIGPGGAVWERFGHNAIGVRDARRGTDKVYNYGLFSFAQEGFLLRFLRGRMQYWMAGFDAAPHLRAYVAANRSIWIQVLDLTPAQRLELARFLEWNALPQNRFYRYDYYRDNCSTRVRDALDRVLGGALRDSTANVDAGTTFRYHTQRALAVDPLLYTGIMLGLGSPTDRPISRWEEMFLPEKVREYVRLVTVPGPGGVARPLVASESTVFVGNADPLAPTPPRWLPAYLALGLMLGGLVGVMARPTSSVWAERGFVGLVVSWSLVVGLVGTAVAALWGLTEHVTSYRNENLFVVNPLWLLVPVAVLVSWRGGWARRIAVVLAVVAAVLSMAGFLLQALPGLDQVNGVVYALFLPPNVAVAIGLLVRRRLTAPPWSPV